MALKTPQQYIESLRDGRVTYWDGERIDDITTHPRFKVPLALVADDYHYDDAEYGGLRRYTTEDGSEAHRIYQIPRSEDDLGTRVELMQHTSIGTLVTGVYMALMSVKDDVGRVNPQYAENIERMYRYCRDNDLRAAEVITDPKGDRKRRAHEQDDPDLYVRIVERRKDGIVVRGAKLHITAASLVHELVVMPTKGMRMERGRLRGVVLDPGQRAWREDHQPQLRTRRTEPASTTRPARITACPRASSCSTTSSSPGTACSWPARCSSRASWRVARSVGAHRRPGRGGPHVASCSSGWRSWSPRCRARTSDPIAQNSIAELITYAEMLRMALDYACRHYESTASGWSIRTSSASTWPSTTTPPTTTRRCATCTTSAAAWC